MRFQILRSWAAFDVRARALTVCAALCASMVLGLEVLTLMPSRGFGMPAWDADTPSEVCTVLIVLGGLGFALSQLWRLRRDPRLRLGWAFATVGMALVATSETADWFNETAPFWNEEFWFEVPLWLIAAACLHQCVRLYDADSRVHRWFRLAIGIQALFATLDIAEGALGSLVPVSADVLEVAVDYAGMLCVLCYVAALLLTRIGPAAGRMTSHVVEAGISALTWAHAGSARAFQPVAIGALARTLFFELHLFRTARYPTRYPILHRRGFRQAVTLGMAVLFGSLIGPRVRRAGVKSLPRQAADLVRMGIGQGVDAISYYLFELYRPGRRAEAQYYLTRYETKNGLLAVLNASRARAADVPHDLTDKSAFGKLCVGAGIATPPILLTAIDGHIEWNMPAPAFDRDLFAKLMRGRGTMKTSLFRRVASLQYMDRRDRVLTLADIAERLRRQSRTVVNRKTTPVILQPRMRNHEDLAGLARDSLIVFRVVTCLNRANEPEVTHAVLRILTKIEPDWDTRPDTEYGAAIDIETGRLSRLTGDKPDSCLVWYDVHPVTGAPVLGRRIKDWPALRDLALVTHGLFRNRIVIGWDVALTTEGPMMIEGNSNMDVSFMQRAYREPIGRSRLGELLAYHLSRL